MWAQDRIVRLLLVASDPLDVARGSGTAMAIARLRAALLSADVSVPVLTPPAHPRSATLQRWRLTHAAPPVGGYDAVLGVNGDGWRIAEQLEVPFIALVKAMYTRALRWEHGAAAIALRFNARWERTGLRHAGCIIAPSHDAADAVIHDYGCEPARVRVIPEPFDTEAWSLALPVRERRGTRVLCVAHMYPRKRIVDLIDAWPLVLRALPDARLDIIGDGPDLRSVSRHAIKLHSVYLHGYVGHPDILEFYARAGAFALPSAQETFGYAVVEALASGLPVVVAASGSLPEIVAGAVAETVPAGDIEALASAIVRSLDEDTRTRAASINPVRAAAYDSRIVARMLIDTVNEMRAAR
jgi:glycosyltransferase involved in cell wall biosynthesis